MWRSLLSWTRVWVYCEGTHSWNMSVALSRCLCRVLSRQTAPSRWVFIVRELSGSEQGCASYVKLTQLRLSSTEMLMNELCQTNSLVWLVLTFIVVCFAASCWENITMLYRALGLHQWWHWRHLLHWGMILAGLYTKYPGTLGIVCDNVQ